MHIRELPGLGPKRLAQLLAQGIYRAADLLHIIPHFIASDESAWAPGQQIQCHGYIQRIQMQFIPRRGAMLTIHFTTQQGTLLKARFFKAPYLKKHFVEQTWFRFSGTLDKKRGDTLVMPKYERIEQGQDSDSSDHAEAGSATHSAKLGPVYAQCPDGFSAVQISNWIKILLDSTIKIDDPLEQMSSEAYTQLLRQIHSATDQELYEAQRQQLALREMCSIFWQLRCLKAQRQEKLAQALSIADKLLNQAIARFPFALSSYQEQALTQVRNALAQKHPALQLIQGDVGCGKSALAFLATWICLNNQASVVYLAPTQILAQQQWALFHALLADSKFDCVLVQSGLQSEFMPNTNKSRVYIGTHALLQDSMQLPQVRLAIIDEQQKFGVAQRQLLIDKCRDAHLHAHVCMLSATPIPRSLSHCLYGDMDLVTIAGRPAQHAQVTSSIIKQPTLKKIASLIQAALDKNEQVLIIAPYLEADHQGVYTARAIYESLNAEMPTQDIALLYGALPDAEQQQIYQRLVSQQCQIVVSTSVIEVGFNLPHATCMLIFNCERFGLAQLHQMRGRLGRGQLAGHCYFATPDPKLHQRLQALLECTDGFQIAEADLKQRGGGDLLGLRQHGIAQTYCCDMLNDQALIQQAQNIIATWRDENTAQQLFCPDKSDLSLG